jgi:lauroyl/myristoyl acyltransferase
MPWTSVLLDFFVSDNDTLYTLMMLAAVGIAIVLTVAVVRQTQAHERWRAARHAATKDEPSHRTTDITT